MKQFSTEDDISWAQYEFGQAQLIDERLNKRLVKIASDFYRQPMASVPQASANAAQAQATYNFFQNEFIEAEQILEPHLQRTIERCAEQQTVLMINDTTYLDFSTQPAKKGLGVLATKESLGMLAHPTLAVTTAGVPLGIVDLQVWARPKEEFGKSDQRNQRLIADKESQKWLNSYLATAKIQAQQPATRFVSISDRESDVYELFELQQSENILMNRPELLTRAAQDRRVTANDPSDPIISRLWEEMERQAVAGTYAIEVPGKDKQPPRTAELEVRFAELTILPPKNRAKNRQPIKLWVIWANEINPPENVEPISWMLLTTIPINSFEEAIEKIHWYKLRWLIELLFKILKSGCGFEKRQLETADRLHRCLVVDIVIAWRILFMIKIGREHPNLPCTVLFEESEWKALYCFINETTDLPEEVPTLQQAVRMVARLGGFLGRKNDGEPGITTLWRGLHRLHDISRSYRLFFPNPVCQGKVMRKD